MRSIVVDEYHLNDAAHQIEHADKVAANAIKCCEFAADRGLINPIALSHITNMAIVAAYAHDVRCYVDRDTHHELGGQWVRDTSDAIKAMFGFSDRDIEYIALACTQHRASFKGKHANILCEIISCADRGAPATDPFDYFSRSYVFARDKFNADATSAAKHAFGHIFDKFGPEGYVNYPPLYYSLYEDKLSEFYTKLEEFRSNGLNHPTLLERLDKCEAKYQEYLASKA